MDIQGALMDIFSQIERDEGYRSHPYKDSMGILTIGIGRNLESDGISLEEARYLAQNDINKRIATLRREFDWFDKLSECRQAVIINMAFNLGMDGFKEFKHMIVALDLGDYIEAAAQMLGSIWAKQVKGRATRLAQQMIDNEWV